MKLVPLFDKIVVKFVEAEETTKSGIVLTSTSKEKPQIAEVIAVGPGGDLDGKSTTMVSKVGDRVVCPKYAGETIKIDEEELVIIKQSEILAIVE